MNGKDLLLSKTTWGVLLQFAALVAVQLGWDLGDLDGWAEALVGAVGAGLALWGRFAAVHKIESIAGVKVGGGQ